jgi:hypothetical protein
VVIPVFVFEHIRQFGDIRLTAPSERPATVTNIAAQMEQARGGEVKDDRAQESKTDYEGQPKQVRLQSGMRLHGTRDCPSRGNGLSV